jgi:hypothetical protein
VQVLILLHVRNDIGRVINGAMSVTEIEDATCIKELKPGEKCYLLKYDR